MNLWVVGHRGAMASCPENTRASFEEAWKSGADAVECDVQLSRDRNAVVIHDPVLDRTTNGQGPVNQQPWSHLKRLDAGSWFSSDFARERLWRLGDLLAWAKPKRSRAGRPLGVMVEIKGHPMAPAALLSRVARDLKRTGFVRRAFVISFDPAAIRRVKTMVPSVRTGFLFSQPIPNLSRRMAWTRADAIFPRHSLVDVGLMGLARRNGWFVGTWTVNKPAEMRRLIKLSVDAMTSNVPAQLRGVIAGME